MSVVTFETHRRITKSGRKSLSLRVPYGWAKALNLEPGMIVSVKVLDDGSLLIQKAEG
jgi:antitoxin component of MazEF toxin-antitoxin module